MSTLLAGQVGQVHTEYRYISIIIQLGGGGGGGMKLAT